MRRHQSEEKPVEQAGRAVIDRGEAVGIEGPPPSVATNVPPVTLVVPVWLSEPVSVSVPVPFLVTLPPPLIEPA